MILYNLSPCLSFGNTLAFFLQGGEKAGKFKRGKAFLLETGNMSENSQRNYICFQTVSCLHNLYRLGHSWVSAMMLILSLNS
jgi:hypothetical protein